MLNVEAIKALYSPNMETMAYLVSRKYGEYSDGFLDIFKTINTLGMRVALADYGKNKDGESLEYCQFVPRSSDKKAYIILKLSFIGYPHVTIRLNYVDGFHQIQSNI